ncbi:hypothetical protein [Georgenia faecalis]|uniref:DUF1289 domain-containing protein n=1 Tax=Georgenia faecalis TaxID=2483799 RepID=A0ABV9DAQ5_9MICO|nr:hypothetical protein [Georgenia faecalis]
MMIDCNSCTMRDIACDDCVVTFLTIPVGPPASARGSLRAVPTPELGEDEQTAIAVLADSGLVPPLRMVRAETG